VTRGEIWTTAGGSGYAGKPRPAVVIQDDRFDATDSVTICSFTSDPSDAPLFRLPITPSHGNGLHNASSLMVDKITTIRRTKLGKRVGRLSNEDILRLNRAIVVFLGLAGS
jgi:mRNA interferase MazF